MQKPPHMNSDGCWDLCSEFLCTDSLARILLFSVLFSVVWGDLSPCGEGAVPVVTVMKWPQFKSAQLPGEVTPSAPPCLCGLVTFVSAKWEMLQLALALKHPPCKGSVPQPQPLCPLEKLSLKYKTLGHLKWNFYFPSYRCLNLKIIFIYNCNFLMCLLEEQHGLLFWKCFDRLLCNMFLRWQFQSFLLVVPHLLSPMEEHKKVELAQWKFFFNYLHFGALLTAKIQVLMKNKIVKEMFWTSKQKGLNYLLCNRIINGEDNEKWRNGLKSKERQHESLGNLKTDEVIQQCSSRRSKKKRWMMAKESVRFQDLWWVGFFRRRKKNI